MFNFQLFINDLYSAKKEENLLEIIIGNLEKKLGSALKNAEKWFEADPQNRHIVIEKIIKNLCFMLDLLSTENERVILLETIIKKRILKLPFEQEIAFKELFSAKTTKEMVSIAQKLASTFSDGRYSINGVRSVACSKPKSGTAATPVKKPSLPIKTITPSEPMAAASDATKLPLVLPQTTSTSSAAQMSPTSAEVNAGLRGFGSLITKTNSALLCRKPEKKRKALLKEGQKPETSTTDLLFKPFVVVTTE